MPAAITMPMTTAAEAMIRGSPSGALVEIRSSAFFVTPSKSAKLLGR